MSRFDPHQIRLLLEGLAQGMSIAAAARALATHRSTVRRCVHAAHELGWDGRTPPDDLLVSRVWRQLARRRRPVTEELLAPWEQLVTDWLQENPPVPLTEVHQRLVRSGVEVSYASLWRFAARRCGAGPDARIRSFLAKARRSRL